jgi:quercetin dioxygenase-like cupin family protein
MDSQKIHSSLFILEQIAERKKYMIKKQVHINNLKLNIKMKKIIVILVAIVTFSCSDMENNTKSEQTLSNKIEYMDKVNSTVYFESDTYKMMLFALKKDQKIEPHSAITDTPLLILEGKTKIVIDSETHILSTGESIILPKNINHAVYPITDIKFVLIK